MSRLLSTSFTNAAHGLTVAQQYSLRLSWWALLAAPLTFYLKVFGFHQLKKSRQGQGRWMTSTASRYYQGRVIETNEPCYISSGYWIRLLKDPELDRAETRSSQPFYRLRFLPAATYILIYSHCIWTLCAVKSIWEIIPITFQIVPKRVSNVAVFTNYQHTRITMTKFCSYCVGAA